MPPTRQSSLPTTPTDELLSPTALWVGGGVYVLLVLISFCFGVWAGNEKTRPVEAASANPAPAPVPSPQPPAPQPTPPEPKPPEPKPPEPKPQPVVTPMPVPPEPKPKPPEPKPTPKIRQVSFQKEIFPIFKDKCILCHGGVKKIEGDLDLRTLATIQKGGASGDALVPGDPDKSSIWVLIESLEMPPAGKERLTFEEQELIKDWILSGGK